ncbi:unnamed protein product [Bursaphelenchus xylophilus]|uniref:(pine wood nematode) hypothetical protein n=1 Tax=Bursaphelenchus xylophilus TaxID=6326 RepID=A0A1I7SSM6_BURXY|nr:unnamed protein product [Bursaphelenchus xylophilus]CAG9097396.1 unnamed protein product [Bursaphelenchus xylophilus]
MNENLPLYDRILGDMRATSFLLVSLLLLFVNGKERQKSLKSLKTQLNQIKDDIELKLSRLKSLRNEIRTLNQELKLNNEKEMLRNVTISESKGFKKRIRNKINGIQKKLRRLEKSFRKHKKTVKDIKKHNGLVNTTPSIIQVFEAQKNRSRPGEHNSPCSTHNECKPGHCCHKKKDENKCVKHSFKIGEGCEDSCSCETHLHCFKPIKGNIKAYCKEARADDFMRGNYRNNQTSIFLD